MTTSDSDAGGSGGVLKGHPRAHSSDRGQGVAEAASPHAAAPAAGVSGSAGVTTTLGGQHGGNWSVLKPVPCAVTPRSPRGDWLRELALGPVSRTELVPTSERTFLALAPVKCDHVVPVPEPVPLLVTLQSPASDWRELVLRELIERKRIREGKWW